MTKQNEKITRSIKDEDESNIKIVETRKQNRTRKNKMKR